MSESVRKKLVFATLPLALIWAAFNYRSAPEPAASAPEVPVVEPSPAATIGAVAPKGLIDIEAVSAARWGADPFRSYRYRGEPGKTRPTTALAWILSGVVHGDNEPMACINKQTVRVGDTVDKATVVAIEKKSVTLEYRGRRLTVAVGKG